jgi:hypothetical protein
MPDPWGAAATRLGAPPAMMTPAFSPRNLPGASFEGLESRKRHRHYLAAVGNQGKKR